MSIKKPRNAFNIRTKKYPTQCPPRSFSHLANLNRKAGINLVENSDGNCNNLYFVTNLSLHKDFRHSKYPHSLYSVRSNLILGLVRRQILDNHHSLLDQRSKIRILIVSPRETHSILVRYWQLFHISDVRFSGSNLVI